MPQVEFVKKVHTGTKRNYLQRVTEHDKAACAVVAKRFGRDFWDGDRKYGYGGYYYDARWRPVAEAMAAHYKLKPDAKILDVGCGKGFLLYEFTQVLPGARVAGIDISQYAIDNAKEEVKPFLRVGNATELPFADGEFDYVVSLLTLHNLYNYDLRQALREIERVCKGHKFLSVDSYRTEQEKVNLMYWQVTCECFYTPQEWEWIFAESGYTGDYEPVLYE